MKSNINYSILNKYTSCFKDKELENEFTENEVKNIVKKIKYALLSLGFFYVLFLIPDSMFLKNTEAFKYIVVDRLIFFSLIVLFYFQLNKSTTFKFYYKWLTVCEFLLTIFFIVIIVCYKNGDFLIQTYGVIVILLIIFVIPNKWLNSLIASLAISIVFFIVSAIIFKDVPYRQYYAAVVYTLAALILCSIYSYAINRYKRINYYNSKELIRISSTDSLTGVYNRTYFDKVLPEYIQKAEKENSPLSLIIFDFDDFKKVNDEYGHLIGDRILSESSRIISKVIPERYVFSRWGGEEFCIILPNTPIEDAYEFAKKLLDIIKGNDFSPAKDVTCSFGVTSLIEGDTINSLVNRADESLYAAKFQGKNCIVSSLTIMGLF